MDWKNLPTAAMEDVADREEMPGKKRRNKFVACIMICRFIRFIKDVAFFAYRCQVQGCQGVILSVNLDVNYLQHKCIFFCTSGCTNS